MGWDARLLREGKKNVFLNLLKGIGFYAYYVVIEGISLYYFHTVHGLFVAGVMMIPFVVNGWINYKKRNMLTVSLWMLPMIVLLIVYWVFVLNP